MPTQDEGVDWNANELAGKVRVHHLGVARPSAMTAWIVVAQPCSQGIAEAVGLGQCEVAL